MPTSTEILLIQLGPPCAPVSATMVSTFSVRPSAALQDLTPISPLWLAGRTPETAFISAIVALELIWSFMLDYENTLNPDRDRKEWVELLSRLCADRIAPAPEILTLARRVMELSKLRPRDALHLACAEYAVCDYFITCDDSLIRKVQRRSRSLKLKVKAINPLEFVRQEVEGHGKDKE